MSIISCFSSFFANTFLYAEKTVVQFNHKWEVDIMPMLLLGLVFVIGLFIYYLATTKVEHRDEEFEDEEIRDDAEDNLKKEENVIFLTGDIESMKAKYKKKR